MQQFHGSQKPSCIRDRLATDIVRARHRFLRGYSSTYIARSCSSYSSITCRLRVPTSGGSHLDKYLARGTFCIMNEQEPSSGVRYGGFTGYPSTIIRSFLLRCLAIFFSETVVNSRVLCVNNSRIIRLKNLYSFRFDRFSGNLTFHAPQSSQFLTTEIFLAIRKQEMVFDARMLSKDNAHQSASLFPADNGGTPHPRSFPVRSAFSSVTFYSPSRVLTEFATVTFSSGVVYSFLSVAANSRQPIASQRDAFLFRILPTPSISDRNLRFATRFYPLPRRRWMQF